MEEEIWQVWMNNPERAEKDLERYIIKKKIKVEKPSETLVKGHINKAEHNLVFAGYIKEEFNDWILVSIYYSIYHASLALCSLKGYSTKDHNATLLLLIKEFLNKELTKEDIETIGKAGLEREHILYYAEAREKRKEASYSTKINFSKTEIEDLRIKAINFLDKVKSIVNYHWERE